MERQAGRTLAGVIRVLECNPQDALAAALVRLTGWCKR
jgi:hypothetical protein